MVGARLADFRAFFIAFVGIVACQRTDATTEQRTGHGTRFRVACCGTDCRTEARTDSRADQAAFFRVVHRRTTRAGSR